MTDREFLRHGLAALAYRAAKSMRGAPTSFATFKAGPDSRAPVEIVAHMGDLFDWALSMAMGEPQWNTATPGSWDAECARFFTSLKAFDDALGSRTEVKYDLTRLFQGPVADALTHTGQLTMLRRMHGAPVKGESYNLAPIEIGRVGADQASPDPRYEFD